MEDQNNHSIRLAVFKWLDQVAPANDYILDWQLLSKGFKFKNEVIPLIGAKGIWKPRVIQGIPISITSVQQSIYSDEIVSDDMMLYSYRGADIMHSDNVGLREAMNHQVPLVYFHQILKGKYFTAWPVFVIKDDPDKLKFTISAENYNVIHDISLLSEPGADYRRKYQTREVLIRLHQKSFRERVLAAYKNHCTICNLKHRVLLDAAHIIPDNEGGLPEITNGLSLCKIHHAAYDQHIIGITPDYRVEVRNDILNEIDGPMLKHGLQEFNHKKLILPSSKKNLPNRESIDIRYQRFKSA
ncbi:HNH endonuclease [Fulvivirga lutimaris]|uniref:HNH endonuclease n=1 Tax=Fulvivirga lutimaris TaxID=1819566 RepID=UPI0012BB8761|nr:HNH endonuclease [Fulvivirga lutimaris]MTI40613.1 HNH endonuclease [Fulvivirga lutimaris]